MEAYCKYNPSDNPYWCNVIWGYCQFQIPSYINEHCPIFNEFPNFPIHVTEVTDEILQKYSYLTFYNQDDNLISLGDTAFQYFKGELDLDVQYVRFIGRYAFQDCMNLNVLDFSKKSDDFIPVLSDITAFMKSDKKTFVNETFKIKVPLKLYDKWIVSPNWIVIQKYIEGV